MNIRGMIKFSLVDYPGRIACVLFSGACNMKCPFCHNPHLVLDPDSQPLMREAQVMNFLRGRVKKLDGVVLSGGEPTLQKGLKAFTDKISDLGFLIKIDSNGSNPETIMERRKSGKLDALGIDYKSCKAKYGEASGSKDQDMHAKVRKTIEYAVKEGIQLDVRSTVHKSLLDYSDLETMRAELDSMGVKEWTLQQFHPVDVIDEKLKELPSYSDRELFDFSKKLGNTKVRGLSGVYLED